MTPTIVFPLHICTEAGNLTNKPKLTYLRFFTLALTVVSHTILNKLYSAHFAL
ncbi:hypothetical protein PNC201_12695 [Pseudoalteromonas sp. NC201]|nr:hypothetical protein PNC201_12695 [Pseudoalteromonas sp. NC201]